MTSTFSYIAFTIFARRYSQFLSFLLPKLLRCFYSLGFLNFKRCFSFLKTNTLFIRSPPFNFMMVETTTPANLGCFLSLTVRSLSPSSAKSSNENQFLLSSFFIITFYFFITAFNLKYSLIAHRSISKKLYFVRC